MTSHTKKAAVKQLPWGLFEHERNGRAAMGLDTNSRSRKVCLGLPCQWDVIPQPTGAEMDRRRRTSVEHDRRRVLPEVIVRVAQVALKDVLVLVVDLVRLVHVEVLEVVSPL